MKKRAGLSIFVFMLLAVAPFMADTLAVAPSKTVDAAAISEKVRIACVGDSITFGAGIKDRPNNSYPAQLQALLGNRFEVRNFGISARTLLKKGDRPYWREKIYKKALKFNPDFVIIKLGTNDIKPGNWQHKDEFAADLKALVESFQALPSKPQVLLSNPVPVQKRRWGMTEENITQGVMPRVKQVADQMGLAVVDFHEAVPAEAQYFSDGIHPNAAGAGLMAEEALKALSGKIKVNSALIPKPKLERDAYDWYKRHDAVKTLIKTQKVDLVFIGDSITHMWGGLPKSRFPVKGAATWEKMYAKRNAVNMGFGWDRIQNVLWRLAHGEFEGIKPKVVVLMIGTNNLTGTKNARKNTPEEIAEGIEAICRQIHKLSPNTRVLLQAILPRKFRANHPWRAEINEVNSIIRKLDKKGYITFIDFGDRFLNEDKSLKRELMKDPVHPGPKGFEVWAEAIEPTLKKLLGE